jgi:hypothetical protein
LNQPAQTNATKGTLPRKRTILLYGRTRGGKTTQLGELAEHVYKTTGKKTIAYACDKGGFDTIQPYVDLGLVQVISQEDTPIFIFLNKATRGFVRDATGKWVKGDFSDIGVVAFESATAFCDAMMDDMIAKASEGTNIGGGGNVSFNVTGDGETLKVGGSNMAMYGVAQSRITQEVWQSHKLPVEYIVWTASASKDEDQNAGGKVIGPAFVGKALTAEAPRWFQYTFRIDATPASSGKTEKHILYLGNNVDLAAGNATALGNTRVPMAATELPSSIEPASIVKALAMIEKAENEAKATIAKRLGLTSPLQ